MASVTKYPTTGADDSSVGTLAWTNPANIVASDNVYATAAVAKGSTATTHYLKATNFGFSIPSGATINGIVVEIEQKASSNATGKRARDSEVKLVKGGAVSGDNKALTSTYYTTSDVWKTYGGSTDLWGLTLSASDINSSSFGAALSCYVEATSASVTVSVDAIRITVYYTIPVSYLNPNSVQCSSTSLSSTLIPGAVQLYPEISTSQTGVPNSNLIPGSVQIQPGKLDGTFTAPNPTLTIQEILFIFPEIIANLLDAKNISLIPGTASLQAGRIDGVLETRSPPLIPGGVSLFAEKLSAISSIGAGLVPGNVQLNAQTISNILGARNPQLIPGNVQINTQVIPNILGARNLELIPGNVQISTQIISNILGAKNPQLIPGNVQINVQSVSDLFASKEPQLVPGAVSLYPSISSFVSGINSLNLQPGSVKIQPGTVDGVFTAHSPVLIISEAGVEFILPQVIVDLFDAQSANLIPGLIYLHPSSAQIVSDTKANLLAGSVSLRANTLDLSGLAKEANLHAGAVSILVSALSSTGTIKEATLIPGAILIAVQNIDGTCTIWDTTLTFPLVTFILAEPLTSTFSSKSPDLIAEAVIITPELLSLLSRLEDPELWVPKFIKQFLLTASKQKTNFVIATRQKETKISASKQKISGLIASKQKNTDVKVE